MPSEGILYFAKGGGFRAEVEASAKRVNAVMGEYPITLVTDTPVDVDAVDTLVLDETEFTKSDKPRSLLKSPYDRTLYLDSDIWLYDGVPELFDILDRFELGLVKDPLEPHVHDRDEPHPIDGVPEAFPEFNTGVMVFRKTANVVALFERWKNHCGPTERRDQRSFRPALYHSDVRFTALPPRYNCIYREANALNGEVKVFHGALVDTRPADHPIDVEDAVETINRHDGSRISYGYKNTVIVHPPIPALVHLHYALREEGVVTTINGILKYISRRLRNVDRVDIDNRQRR